MNILWGNPLQELLVKELLDLSELYAVKGMSNSYFIKLAKYLTVISHSIDNTNKININTASSFVIAAVLNIDISLAQRLVYERNNQPYKSYTQITDIINNISDLKNLVEFSSSYFTAHISVQVADYEYNFISFLYRRSRGGQWPIVIWGHQV